MSLPVNNKNSGKPGTSRYITTKNKKNNPERLELKKLNPILKKSGIFLFQCLSLYKAIASLRVAFLL